MRTRTKKPLAGALAGLEASTRFEDCPLTGKHCADCGRPQRETISGVVCENGHGDAPSYEDERASGKPTNALPLRESIRTPIPIESTISDDGALFFTPVSADPELPPIVVVEVDDRPIPTGGNPLEPLLISTIEQARELVDGAGLWLEPLLIDREGRYMNPGEHADDCPVKLGALCECPVGYVEHYVKPDVAIAVSQKVVGKLTLGQAIEMGYKLDVSFEERIAGDHDSVIIHVPVGRHLLGPPESHATESVTEEEITTAVAALKKSAERSKTKTKTKFRIPKRTPSGARIRFVAVGTRELVDVKTIEQLGEILRGPNLGGAMVKVGVPVAASCRDAFDGAGIKALLIAHGASSVTLAPRIFADTAVTTSAKVAAAEAQSPEESIREWFAGQSGLSDEERECAVELALEIMEGV